MSDAQRVELAAALDPGRRGLHVRLDNQAATLATYRRECDEALRKKGEMVDRAVRAERERDEWKARAEAAAREREEIADQFATFRAEIVAEAVKSRESAVSRAAAFDAWLAKVKADAWDDGYKDCFLSIDGSGWRELEDNPYRKGGRL